MTGLTRKVRLGKFGGDKSVLYLDKRVGHMGTVAMCQGRTAQEEVCVSSRELRFWRKERTELPPETRSPGHAAGRWFPGPGTWHQGRGEFCSPCAPGALGILSRHHLPFSEELDVSSPPAAQTLTELCRESLTGTRQPGASRSLKRLGPLPPENQTRSETPADDTHECLSLL